MIHEMDEEDPEILRVFDSLIGLWRRQSPEHEPYWVMRHQLVHCCDNKNEAQEDLDLLLQDNLVYQLRLPSLTRNETLVFYKHDFSRLIRFHVKQSPPVQQDILDVFLSDAHVALTGQLRLKDVEQCLGTFSGVRSEQRLQEAINELIRLGVMRQERHAIYCIMVPGTGKFISNLLAGRRAVASVFSKRLKRNRHSTGILRSEMESRYGQCLVGRSCLTMEFLLSDMLGVGLLREV